MEEHPNAEQLKQIELLKKRVLGTILSKEAYERLGRFRLANSELAAQVEGYLIQVYQAGKLSEPITDEQLKEVLQAVTSNTKRDFNIKFR